MIKETNKETPPDSQSEKKNKSQELWESTKDSIKNILKPNWKTLNWEVSDNYFNWKPHKFNVTEFQARSNSTMIENLLNNINKKNKDEKLRKLWEEISKQYKQATWEDIELSEKQLQTILETHQLDWNLWELTPQELRQKVKSLDKTIKEKNIRRFLLEAGFCGYLENLTERQIYYLTKEQLENIRIINDELWIKIFFKNLKYMKNIKLNKEQVKNIKIIKNELWFEIKLSTDLDTVKDLKLTKKEIETLKKNIWIIRDELWIIIEITDIEKIKDLKLTKKDIKTIKRNIQFIKNNQSYNIKVDDIYEIKNLTENDIEKGFKVLKELWGYYNYNTKIIFWIFPKLTEEQILSLKQILPFKRYWYWRSKDIHMLFSLINNANRETIRNFIKRKNKYLEKNKTISKETFRDLFWWNGKYWKPEIRQKSLWLCYAYTWFELLKKTNWFDEIIQTNLKETENWREVRLPFCDENWKWIKVNKEEIDKKFSIQKEIDEEYLLPYTNQENRTFCINSESEYLWFKILEIAFIKQKIINYVNTKPNEYKKIYTDFKKTWDFTLDWELIIKITEGWDTTTMLKNILPQNYTIINYYIDDINNEKKDFIFDQFSKWLLKVKICPKRNRKLNNYDTRTTRQHFKKPHKFLVREFFRKTMGDLPMESYESSHSNDKIFSHHAYSIERCYTTPKWEKRVRIVNPRNTWEKIDISLKDCKDLFRRSVLWLDIDKMFR